MKYLLLNSLKFGGAERVAQVMSKLELFDGVIILEDEQDYVVDLPVIKLSRHTSRTNKIFKTLFIPIYAFRLKRIVNKKDIVISFVERANFVNIFTKFLVGNKTIITLHTNLTNTFKNRKKFLYYFLIKILYPYTDCAVSVSRGIESDLNNIVHISGIKKVIYNPLDLNEIMAKSKVLLNPDLNSIFLNSVLINTGRMVEEKAQWILLDVFKKLLKKNRKDKLIILGDGELREKLIDHSKKIGLKTYSIFEDKNINDSFDVYFLGYQENPYKFYSKSSLFVLTSTSEGLPVSILEAMACKLPIISSDCDYGPRELIAPETNLDLKIQQSEFDEFGILAPVLSKKNNNKFDKKEDDWVNSINIILSDYKLIKKYQENGLKRIESFSMDNIKSDWIFLLNNLK